MANYGHARLALFGSYLIEIRSLLDNKLLLGSQLFSLTCLQLVTYVVHRALVNLTAQAILQSPILMVLTAMLPLIIVNVIPKLFAFQHSFTMAFFILNPS